MRLHMAKERRVYNTAAQTNSDFTDGGIDRSVLYKTEIREGVRLVHRKDGSTVPVAFVVAPTRVAGLGYFVAVSWELSPDDPRSRDAR